ncbi:MAG: bifunctional riboflavin kinase/FAD synthetase [Rickettsiaceae bacterium]|jgi:riboflavin kinase/FMN adenylyltransferase|nr:bifunctional riboflavin kinase/FAD synthetase [Rickettsiaceae bacterium]
MQIIKLSANIPSTAKGTSVTLGNFDGIHKGHQAIIKETMDIAKRLNTPAAVMTFEPHPVSVFKPDLPNFRLTTLEQKAALLEEMGIDFLFVVDFNKEFSSLSAKDFIKEILVEKLEAQQIIIGYDFIFGKNRGGNADLLQSLSSKYNYNFTQVEAIGSNDEIFSSTKIRENLKNGNLGKAKTMLGRNYSIAGFVEKGDNRGKDLGFPTINVNTGEMIRPKSGVYAVKARILTDNTVYKAVANIGAKPTFSGQSETLEAHIFDFSNHIYGANVEIEFIEYIRPEQKFANVEQLKAQIQQDCVRAMELLS